MTKDHRLVYSTDPKMNQKCAKCKALVSECTCEKQKSQSKFVAKLRIEKKSRGGKTVTVIDGLPKVEIYLKELAKKLKKRCGSGGTVDLTGKEGIIEIQGDKRDQIRIALEKEGISYKG